MMCDCWYVYFRKLSELQKWFSFSLISFFFFDEIAFLNHSGILLMIVVWRILSNFFLWIILALEPGGVRKINVSNWRTEGPLFFSDRRYLSFFFQNEEVVNTFLTFNPFLKDFKSFQALEQIRFFVLSWRRLHG